MTKQDKAAIVGTLASEAFSVGESIKLASQGQAKRDYDSENEQISIDNRKAKQAFRKKWDKLLSWLVVIGFFFSYLIIFLIGFGILKFKDNAFAVPSIVAIGIVQTYGLARLAVSYFFSEDGDARKKKK
jgi:hypothetical protein